ncbi:MAG TPA: MFS transporter [Candidatus Methylomirabilis sp.]
MRFPSGIRALTHRDYRLFWSGQAVSLIGSWMQTVGQSWLVLELTNSPFKLGAVAALQWMPMLFLSFVGGALADRMAKRRLIIGTQTALLIQAFVLSGLVWSGHVRYWHVAVLACLLGIVNTADIPARQSFIVEMVGPEDLINGIALNSAAFNAARVVGPAVAGLLIARFGIAPAFLLNGLSFLAVIGALLAMRAEGLPRPRRGTTMAQEIAEGIRYAVASPRVSLILSLVLAISIFVINYGVMVPLLARDVLHQDAHGFGLLMAAIGGGALAGAFALALLGQGRPPLALVITPAILISAATLSLADVRQFWLAATVLGLVGLCHTLFLGSCNTTLQLGAPGELRGRVMGLYAFVFSGVTPIGSLFMGSVAETLGVPAAYAAGGGLGLLSVAALVAAWRYRHRR